MNDDPIVAIRRILSTGSKKMDYISLYLVTAFVFLMLDVVMLKKVLYPLFSANIGGIMHEDPKMGAAAVFYLFYVGGIIWFASLPALAAGTWPKKEKRKNAPKSRRQRADLDDIFLPGPKFRQEAVSGANHT